MSEVYKILLQNAIKSKQKLAEKLRHLKIKNSKNDATKINTKNCLK